MFEEWEEIDRYLDMRREDLLDEQCALVLAEIKKAIRNMRELEREIETILAERLDNIGQKTLSLDSVGIFERKWSSPAKKWDSEAIISKMFQKLPDIPRLIDKKTGEIQSDADALVSLLAKCARLEWRATPLKELGLDPDEYAEKTTNGRYTIRFDPAPKFWEQKND
jgi:hypothetical protein